MSWVYRACLTVIKTSKGGICKIFKFSQLNLSLLTDFITIADTSGSEEFLEKKNCRRAPLGILGKNLCSNATKYYHSKVYGL